MMDWFMDILHRRRAKAPRPPVPPVPWFRSCEYLFVIPFAVINIIFVYILLLYLIQFHWWGMTSTDYPTADLVSKPWELYELDITQRRHRLSNMHFVFMPLGLYLFSGLSVLLYRMCCCYSRRTVKIIHMLMHLPAIPTTIYGFMAIKYFHMHVETPYDRRFYTFHAWLGFFVMFLHIFQLITGSIIFLYVPAVKPLGSARFRARYTPYHFFFGMAEFFFVIQLCATGLVLGGLHMNRWDGYPSAATNSYMFDLYARQRFPLRLLLALFTTSCVLVFHALIRDDFRHRGRILLTLDRV